MKPPPSKHFRLVCWWLTYRVPVESEALDIHFEAAVTHCRMGLFEFLAGMRRWPAEFAKVVTKRERRRQWLAVHGSIPQGWTPPDPQDPRTANRPQAAWRARLSRKQRRALEAARPQPSLHTVRPLF